MNLKEMTLVELIEQLEAAQDVLDSKASTVLQRNEALKDIASITKELRIRTALASL